MTQPFRLSYFQESGNRRLRGLIFVPALLFLTGAGILFAPFGATRGAAQENEAADDVIGERLTYNISFNNIDTAGYAEISVVSRGKLEGADAIELSGKLRSYSLFGAAFSQWNEARTTYIAPGNGLPLYVKHVDSSGILPAETVFNYLESPSPYHDLLSMIYLLRRSAGTGTFTVMESGQVHTFTFTNNGMRSVVTGAGRFEAAVSTVESSYLSQFGITDVMVGFSEEGNHVPVFLSCRTPKGELSAELASIQKTEEREAATPTPTPVRTPTPTPTPAPTPPPYIDNQPLGADLPFALGESLEYRLSKQGEDAGRIRLRAAERRLYQGIDSLRLVASVLKSESLPGGPESEDSVESWVNPETLAPYSLEMKLSGDLLHLNVSAVFDQARGTARIAGGNEVAIPVGTHNLLSLLYAMRAFNLKPGLDPKDPVNDTRVALFGGTAPMILALRPSETEKVEYRGRQVSTQPVSIRTGDPAVDSLNPKIWLSLDARRLPLRFTYAGYTADLVSSGTLISQ